LGPLAAPFAFIRCGYNHLNKGWFVENKLLFRTMDMPEHLPTSTLSASVLKFPSSEGTPLFLQNMARSWMPAC